MKFEGIWPGIVVDNKDPLKEGRVKVRTTQFGSSASVNKIPDGDLPWAFPCFPVVGKNMGMAMVPEIGSGVWVFFYQNDARHPVWIGGWFGTGDAMPEHTYTGGVPSAFVIKSRLGHKIVISDNPSFIEITDAAGQTMKLNTKELEALFTFLGDFNATVAKKTTWTSTLKMTITALAALAISVGAGFSMAVVGTITITAAAAIQILSTDITLGQVATAQKLCNTTFLAFYNLHTHTYNPGPLPPAVTTPPVVPAVIDTHTTTNLKGS